MPRYGFNFQWMFWHHGDLPEEADKKALDFLAGITLIRQSQRNKTPVKMLCSWDCLSFSSISHGICADLNSGKA